MAGALVGGLLVIAHTLPIPNVQADQETGIPDQSGTISSDVWTCITDIIGSCSQALPSTERFRIYIERSVTCNRALTWKRWAVQK